MAQNYLFRRINIYDLMADREMRLSKAVGQLSEDQFKDQGHLAELATQFEIRIPELLESEQAASHRPVKRDVSHDPMGMIFGDGPHYIDAMEVTLHVPYTGEGMMFEVIPSTFSTNPPAGEYDERELRISATSIEGRDIKPDLDGAIRSIRQHLEWLQPSAAQLKAKLAAALQTAIQKRKVSESQKETVLANLGIPIRAVVASTPAPSPIRPAGSTKKVTTEHRLDFFICHASEDKLSIARPLAEALIARGFKVWYDEFSLKVGDTLHASIDRGLAESKFGIVILSEAFFSKHWTQQELNGLASLEVSGRKVILPVWHDVEVDEVRKHSPIMAGRIAAKSKDGIDVVVGKLIDAM